MGKVKSYTSCLEELLEFFSYEPMDAVTEIEITSALQEHCPGDYTIEITASDRETIVAIKFTDPKEEMWWRLKYS